MKNETTVVIVSMLTLVILGGLMVYSVGAIRDPNAMLFLKHSVYVTAGITAFLFMSRFNYHYLGSPAILRYFVLLSLLLLGLTFVPGFRLSMGGAARWIGWRHISFQPSEFAKFVLILWLAARLTQHQEKIHRFFAGFVMPFSIAGLYAAIVLAQRDVGIPFVMLVTTLTMVWVAGARKIYIIGSGIALNILVIPLITLQPYRVERIIAFLDPWTYRQETGWQLIQSLSAFAQGGFWGRGAGAGEQKLGYLPAAHTDFVYAVVGEELGLVGTLATLLLFAILMYAALRIASNAPDLFGTLLASGICTLIVFQGLFIMGVTLGLLPTKGLPLPFVSYGGTAIVMSLFMMGIIVNIGAQSVEVERPPNRRKAESLRHRRQPGIIDHAPSAARKCRA